MAEKNKRKGWTEQDLKEYIGRIIKCMWCHKGETKIKSTAEILTMQMPVRYGDSMQQGLWPHARCPKCMLFTPIDPPGSED